MTLHRPEDTVDRISRHIERELKNKLSVFFVQIGSNDGIRGDPLYRLVSTQKSWSGILIEPVPFFFERLKRNYSHGNKLIFENAAISEKREIRRFYYVSEMASVQLGQDLPYWHDQLGSFRRNHILNHLEGILEPFIMECEVQCFRLNDVLKLHQVHRIDLVHIDAEGYDWIVLSQIDFEKYRPAIIVFEHTNLKRADLDNAKSLLKKEMYNCTEYRTDIVASLTT